jgi:NAD(P)-dependent dehydrogenase (short-subunit alcohol dehydrogenase family)
MSDRLADKVAIVTGAGSRGPGIGNGNAEGTAWDVGWGAVYLASDEARWVTGQVLVIDAGLTATTAR